MEYIHKAKAEKARTKVLSDQMEARRTKNKVPRFQILSDRKSDSFFPFRLLGNVVLRGLQRRGKHSLRKTHPRRSEFPHTTRFYVFVTVVRYASHVPYQPPHPADPPSAGLRISIDCATSKQRRPQDLITTPSRTSGFIIVPLLSWTILTLDLH
jgi:hypothetical protein